MGHDVLPAFDAARLIGIVSLSCVNRTKSEWNARNYINSCRHSGVLLTAVSKIALVTDGRLFRRFQVPFSYPRNAGSLRWRLLAKVRDGDIIRVNGQTGELTSPAGRRGGTFAARHLHIPT